MTEDSKRNITTVKSVDLPNGNAVVQSDASGDLIQLGVYDSTQELSVVSQLHTTHALDLAIVLAEQALRKTPGHPLAPRIRDLLLDLHAS